MNVTNRQTPHDGIGCACEAARSKIGDCRRMSGPSLLEVRCRQYTHGMWRIVSTDDACDTQTPLYAAVGLAFVTDDDIKVLKNAPYFCL